MALKVDFNQFLGCIKVDYNQHTTTIKRSLNCHNSEEKQLELWERMCTFEGKGHNSEMKEVTSKIVRNKFLSICRKISDHIKEVTAHTCEPTRMVLYFRADYDGNFVLCYCSKIKFKLMNGMKKPLISKNSKNKNRGQRKSTSPRMTLAKEGHMPKFDDYVNKVKLNNGHFQSLAKGENYPKNCPICLRKEF